MAEGEDVGWWRSWLQQSYQAVKEKSSEALEFMKRDLTEFTQVVQHDTACTIAATASVVKEKLATEGSSGATEKMKKGLSDFLGVISDTFAPSADKTIDCDVITLMGTPSGTAELYDGTKARLYSLQSDPATYCNEPDGPPELFDAWLSQFCLEEKKGEISELLVGSPSIRALYTKMVPAAVSHSEFWHRYFYKVHQLEQEQARRDALKQRAEQSISEEPRWEEEEERGREREKNIHVRKKHQSTASCTCLDGIEPASWVCAQLGNRTHDFSVYWMGRRSNQLSHTEELVGISPTPPEEAKVPVAQTCTSLEGGPGPQSPGEENLVTPVEPPTEVTPSESSESISLVTQVAKSATTPEAPGLPKDLSQKLLEASLEEQNLAVDVGETGPPPPAQSKPHASAGRPSGPEPRPPARVETLREEVLTDLRVFELNSDSGKSTPSNNGKKGSSTDISEDWEKDFDLDMTEEEVQMALSKVDASGEGGPCAYPRWQPAERERGPPTQA
ncbi:PREDICTED: BSD domain-containing protein 1 isoform X2 [Myotis davidii]|uniref:BSD domain-containing protein 1 isoform X2 n=1 Tax=Myotis davidii TaxID=225400 RepID=UPI0007670530|nr:PREDICTED: BSD domain-containing protein 1 isoform X2 [Myotis davidii]